MTVQYWVVIVFLDMRKPLDNAGLILVGAGYMHLLSLTIRICIHVMQLKRGVTIYGSNMSSVMFHYY